MVRIEVVVGSLIGMGESPVWDVDEQRLYWVDNSRSRIWRSTADGRELSVWSFPGRVTSLARRAKGGLIAASRTTLCTFDLDTGEGEVIFDAGKGAGFVFNDAKADRQGRFIAGLVELALVAPAARQLVDRYETAGGLYRLDSDATVMALASGIGVANGPCFSPDGATFYCGDSWSRRVWAFDYDVTTGTASNRRLFASVGEGDALPDGATIDAEGFLWIATFEGGEIHRYAPDGRLDRRVAVPVHPTSVMFGGPDLDVLFLTSRGGVAVPGRTAEVDGLGGCVFAIHGLGVNGVPEVRVAA
jgi:sugar lactone lactonase YvrE